MCIWTMFALDSVPVLLLPILKLQFKGNVNQSAQIACQAVTVKIMTYKFVSLVQFMQLRLTPS